MATVRMRGNSWQARIRLTGEHPISRSFRLKSEVLTWTHTVESALDRGIYINYSPAEHTSLAAVILRYETEVLPTLRGAESECQLPG